MARRAVLGGGSLNPFGGGGLDFGAFNILDRGNEAYLAFLKVETAWNAGKATNDEYLAALEKYANAQDANSSDWVSLHARLEQAKYQVARNVIVDKIDNRQATYADLVAFDRDKLTGLNPDSLEYGDRLAAYRNSQARLIAEEEKKKVDLYQTGKLTTTQLRKWYQDVLGGPVIDNNPELEESLKDRITELADRVQTEKDNKVLADFNDGKMSTADFIAYATGAKARYAAGTSQAQEWDARLKDARENASETSLLYRYNLSQQYADLDRFVKSNAGGAGRTSTSTSTRVVLGADGKWKTVRVTTTKAVKPSAAEVDAHRKLQIEIADAKRQMAEIARKVSGVGGFVETKTVMSFYQRKLGTLARGSSAWYAVQGKIDNLNDRIHQESVWGRQGIRITYPKGGGGGATASGGGGGGTARPSGTGGGDISLAQFMRAIATQESGGRYDARNASSGAYGKYQIMPANWSSWAVKAGLPANAPQTPENQERVALAAFQRLAKSYDNDWSRVAAAWFAGVAGSRDPNRWGPRTRRYVDAIMGHLGTTRAAVAAPSGGGGGGGSYRPSLTGAPVASSPAAGGKARPAAGSGAGGGSGPLSRITSVAVGGRKTRTEVIGTTSTGFPVNLDGRAFEKFYANYERAFESGAEAFVDSSSGKPVAYFIGDDPAERIERMRQLDDLRVELFDERAIAYQGTASELTAMNARNEAYKDVARHEYMIVDTAAKVVGGSTDPKTRTTTGGTTSGSLKLNMLTNPLASGIRLLDKTKAAIASNLAMAEAAYKRGDITGSYSLFQMAKQLLDANGVQAKLIAGYADAAQAKIDAITRATGGITPEAALGAEKGGEFAADLARLQSFDVELTGLFVGTSAEKTMTELEKHIKKTPDNKVVWDSNDAKGQLVLNDDSYIKLKENGEIELDSAPPVYDGTTGKMTKRIDKTVEVTLKIGAGVIRAQAEYKVDEVGSIVAPDGKLYKIYGKVVSQRGPDGKWVNYYENPLNPGAMEGSWSRTPWLINAPSGFKSVADGKGGAIFMFTRPNGQGDPRAIGREQTDGWTYKLVFDPGTGTYLVTGDHPGSLLGDGPKKDELVGSAGDLDITQLFADSGFVRTNGGGGFDSTVMPVFGFSDFSDYEEHLRSFQPPAVANIGKVPTGASGYGGWGGPRMGNTGGGKPPVDEDRFGTRRPADSPTAGGWGGPRLGDMVVDPPKVNPTYGGWGGPRLGDTPGQKSSTRADLPSLPTDRHGGLTPEERDEDARRAALPDIPAGGKRATGSKRRVAPPPKSVPPPSKSTTSAADQRRRKSAPARKPLPKVVPPPVRPKSGLKAL